MKIGVSMFCTPYSIGIVPLAKLVEQLGFDSLFVPEHPAIPKDAATPFPSGGPIPRHCKEVIDPFVGLAAAGVDTKDCTRGVSKSRFASPLEARRLESCGKKTLLVSRQ